MTPPLMPQSEYTPDQWRTIMRNAHAKLAADPTNERARAALRAAIPQVQNQNQATSQQEMSEAQDPGFWRSLGMGASQGATFTFGDEVSGLLAASGEYLRGDQGFGDAYREHRDTSREMLAQSREHQPLAAAIGDIAGAAGTMIPGAAAAGARAGIGAAQLGARVAPRVAPAIGRLVGRVAGGALAGAGDQALRGAGEADGSLGERVTAAGGGLQRGAILGGAFGLGAPILAEGLKAGGGRLMRFAGLGEQGWLRKGLRRAATGSPEAAAPKATPKAKPRARARRLPVEGEVRTGPKPDIGVPETEVVRRSLTRPKVGKSTDSQILGPNQPRPGHPIYRTERAPTRSPEVRGGEPLTPSKPSSPRGKSGKPDRGLARGQLESIPTEQLQQAKALASGNRELLRMIDREIARRASGT